MSSSKGAQMSGPRPEAGRSASTAGRGRALLSIRAWLVAAVLVLLGAAGGAAAGIALLGDRVVAESRLVVGDQTIRAQSVPGYALATQQLAVTYSRLVAADAVIEAVPDGVEADASPIADSAIIRVRAEASDDATALAAADAVAQALVAAAGEARTRNSGDAIAEQYVSAREALDDARGAAGATGATSAAAYQVELAQGRVDALAQAYRERVLATANNATALTVSQKAEVASSSRPRAGALGALVGGAAVAFVLGVAYLIRARRA